MEVFLDEFAVFETMNEVAETHHIGLIPVLRILPTRSHFTLGCEVDHIVGFGAINERQDLSNVLVQIQLKKTEVLPTLVVPVGHEDF